MIARGDVEIPELRDIVTLCSIDRRRGDAAAVRDGGLRHLLHARWMCDAARDDESLRRVLRNSARIATPTVDSDGVNLTLRARGVGEQQPHTAVAPLASSPMSARSAAAAVDGREVELKSPVCTMVPAA